MEILLYIYLFFLGASIASFINALMYRIEANMKLKEMLFSRSHCDNCSKELSWYELIPVLSWFILKGKCPKCKKKFEIYHSLSELVLGISFILIFMFHQNIAFGIIFACILFALTYSDYHTKSIPRTLTHIILIFGGIYFVTQFQITNLISIGYFALIALGVFVLNYFKKSFGFGDVLLFLFFALIFPPSKYIIFLLLTLYISAAFSIVLVIKDRSYLKKYIPLVPFMYIAFILTPIIQINFPWF